MSGAGPLRNRSFGTHCRGRRPARATVCRIPCLILCLADVERVGPCRAPNAPGGVHGRIASVIASLVSPASQPPPARASYLEHLILPTATATTPGRRRPLRLDAAVALDRPTVGPIAASESVTVGFDTRITGIRNVDLEAVEILQLVVWVVAEPSKEGVD